MTTKLQELFETGLKFHGHKCPAMPMGLRAGLAALQALGVERAKNKELMVISETGKGRAAGCFLDGVMAATGCTCGKSNIQKLYYNKMAFTLIDVKHNRSVRVSLKPDFFEGALNSPFVQQRAKGVEPQDIPAEIVDPLVEKVLDLPDEQFLEIGEIQAMEAPPRKRHIQDPALPSLWRGDLRQQVTCHRGRRFRPHPLLRLGLLREAGK